MDVDLPYKIEYAKSGRAGCKVCKNPIVKDELRIATVVQNPYHDSKMDRWHHLECFFQKQKPKTISDIANFDNIRWEDQQIVEKAIAERNTISKLTSVSASDTSNKKKGKSQGRKREQSAPARPDCDLMVEYATSSRSICRGCDEKIIVREVRVLNKDYESDDARRYGGLDRWYHLECFAKLRSKLGFVDDGLNIPGADTLSDEDKETLIKLLPKSNDENIPSDAKKIKIDGEEKKMQEQNKEFFEMRDELSKYSKTILIELLQYNYQYVPFNLNEILDVLADAMTFGAVRPCPKCNVPLKHVPGTGYKCSKRLNQFLLCDFTTQEPERVIFNIPMGIRGLTDFTSSYKSVPKRRLSKVIVFCSNETVSNKILRNTYREKVDPDSKLQDVTHVYQDDDGIYSVTLGRVDDKTFFKMQILEDNKDVCYWLFQKWGQIGSKERNVKCEKLYLCECTATFRLIYAEKTCNVFGNISSFVKQPNKMYHIDIDNGKIVDVIDKYISNKDSEPPEIIKSPASISQIKNVIDSIKNEAKTEPIKNSITVTSSLESNDKCEITVDFFRFEIDGIVDSDSKLQNILQVYQDIKGLYSVTLGSTDSVTKEQKFYKMQVLHNRYIGIQTQEYWFFCKWGKIGTKGEHICQKMLFFECLAKFRLTYAEKTGNVFGNKTFVKKPNKMYLIDIDFNAIDSGTSSKSESSKMMAPSTSSAKPEDDTDGVKIQARPRPLKNLNFYISSKIKNGDKDIKREIMLLGGNVKNKLSADLFAVISTEEEVSEMSRMIKSAQKFDVHVVSVDFVEEAKDIKNTAIELLKKKSIAPWGSDTKIKVPESTVKNSPLKSSNRYEISGVAKQRVKGGEVVDPDSELQDVAHVFQRGDDKYTVTLGYTDLQMNKNSFYKMQILKHDKEDRYWLFCKWGRIGTKIGSYKCESMSLTECIDEFKDIYFKKTDNYWGYIEDFEQQPGKMYHIEMDHMITDDTILFDSDIESKLEKPLQELMKFIFNIKAMRNSLLEYNIDVEKMPLGKISKQEIYGAYKELKEILLYIKSGNPNRQLLIKMSNAFYTSIPHNFGLKKPKIIETEEEVVAKRKMLDSMLEMQVAYDILHTEIDSSKNPIDGYYELLKTTIHVLDKKSEEFALIEKYVNNTNCEHHRLNLSIEEIFVIKKESEESRFKPFKNLHNRRLLWHGSRSTNFAEILSSGLKIAPPEAPHSGYTFGKGVYFADMVSKSANYCCANTKNPTGLLLLCEVALGNMYVPNDWAYIDKLPDGKHSTWARGDCQPDPKESVKLENDVEVPCGRGIEVKNDNNFLLWHSEFIVYNVSQIKMKYLVKMNFKY